MDVHSSETKLGLAWLALALAVGLHVIDEAATGFLSIYNPTVIEMRHRWGWFPMPTFTFESWLEGLAAFVLLLLVLSPFAFHNAGWIRPIAYFMGALMICNAVGHTAATLLGRTVASVHVSRPAPGFYSSPALVIASVYLLIQLRRTAHAPGRHRAANAG